MNVEKLLIPGLAQSSVSPSDGRGWTLNRVAPRAPYPGALGSLPGVSGVSKDTALCPASWSGRLRGFWTGLFWPVKVSVSEGPGAAPSGPAVSRVARKTRAGLDF